MAKLHHKTKRIFCSLIRGNFESEKESKEIDVINGIPQYDTSQEQLETKIENKNNTTSKTIERQIPGHPAEVVVIKNGRLPSIKKYWNFLIASGKSKTTIQEYRYDYKWWNIKAQSISKTAYSLNIVDIENFLKGMNPSTVRRKIAFLKSLAKWYLREGKAKLWEEVCKIVPPKIPEKLPGDYGAKEFETIRRLSKELVKEIKQEGIWMGLMLMSGLRISEIKTAKIKDDKYVLVLGKGNKERLIPTPHWLIEAMKKMPGENTGGWKKSRARIYAKVKSRGYKPHCLRHTYASELIRRGKRIEEIKVLLGHKDISTTTIYAKVDIPDDAANLLDS